MSNIQTGGGLVVAQAKPSAPVTQTPVVPSHAEAVPSQHFPPIAPSANSQSVVMEVAATPPNETIAKAEGIEVDNIPITNDAAVLIDDVPTLALPKGEEPQPEAKDTNPDAPTPENNKTRHLAEAAERVYAEERQISAVQDSSKPPEPERAEDPIPPP